MYLRHCLVAECVDTLSNHSLRGVGNCENARRVKVWSNYQHEGGLAACEHMLEAIMGAAITGLQPPYKSLPDSDSSTNDSGKSAIIAYRIITSPTSFPFERLRLYPVSAYYIKALVPWDLVREEYMYLFINIYLLTFLTSAALPILIT